MKVYTKKGDNGTTQLLGGRIVDKFSSKIDAYGDIDELNAFIGHIYPENRFNTRSSGLEINLLHGNPTMDLINGTARTMSQLMKATLREDYRFSRTDLNRAMRLFPFQNMYGVTNILNYIRDNSGLPSKGKTSKL